MPSPVVAAAAAAASGQLGGVARHRAYSLDVPCSRHMGGTRYSSGDSSSRKSSRHDEHNNSNMSNNSNSNMSNNTLHSSGGLMIGDQLSGIRIRIGSADAATATASATAATSTGGAATAAVGVGNVEPALMPPSVSCELGLASGSSSSEAAPKI
ncbi:hypothetical protein KR044_010585 [Drosophila immigrans]|nr:hypothetical protein KR044_010585 [Drosophila immigrans]